MTFWDFVGDTGLGLATAAAILVAWMILLFVSGEIQMWRRRRWEARKEALVNTVDALLLARRLREDREVAALDAAFDLPSAPGSFFRRDTP